MLIISLDYYYYYYHHHHHHHHHHHECYEFEGFKEEMTHDAPENNLIADRIKVMIQELKVDNKQPLNIRMLNGRMLRSKLKRKTMQLKTSK